MKNSILKFSLVMAAASAACLSSGARTQTLDDTLSAALSGDARAQSRVGMLFYNGDAVTRDTAQAAKWFRKSADQGNADAQYNLAQLYLNGDGVEKSETEALKWLTLAALNGQSSAQVMMGLAMGGGLKTVPHDDRQSLAWFTLAAESGNLQAAELLETLDAGMNEDDRVAAAEIHTKLKAILAAKGVRP